MHVVLLGTAAGGGFPQWNCWCPTCRAARISPHRAAPRRQSSTAVSVDGERWFLLNASPDVREQVDCLPGRVPAGVRHVAVEGIVTTDAELDHTLGIVLLREARHLQLFATGAMRLILEEDSRILPLARAFARVEVTEMQLAQPEELRYRNGDPSGMTMTPFEVPAGPPRFARQIGEGHTVGLILRDDNSGGSCAYVPGCGALDARMLERLGETDLILFDGTFWTDDELISLGIGDRSAREMDHQPISGAGGSLSQLAGLPHPEKVYVHINNTNPILVEDSPERALVERSGLTVGTDGMTFSL
ncbi:MAG TPA: pyrroloquinoline quinone biosynthesis protein PqqB [Gemmatimonadales bacterium]|nr:pyrroloquinoline quinone biosynthesis protein PqqB [Gemmatimonadales bacterium]